MSWFAGIVSSLQARWAAYLRECDEWGLWKWTPDALQPVSVEAIRAARARRYHAEQEVARAARNLAIDRRGAQARADAAQTPVQFYKAQKRVAAVYGAEQRLRDAEDALARGISRR